MIHVTRLFEQEDVGESDEQYRGGKAIKEPNDHARGCEAEHDKVNIHAAAGPGPHPTESVIREIDNRFNKVTSDPTVSEVAINFPKQDAAEKDAEENQE